MLLGQVPLGQGLGGQATAVQGHAQRRDGSEWEQEEPPPCTLLARQLMMILLRRFRQLPSVAPQFHIAAANIAPHPPPRPTPPHPLCSPQPPTARALLRQWVSGAGALPAGVRPSPAVNCAAELIKCLLHIGLEKGKMGGWRIPLSTRGSLTLFGSLCVMDVYSSRMFRVSGCTPYAQLAWHTQLCRFVLSRTL